MSDSTANRDATSLRILGNFFLVLGVLVVIATGWALENRAAAVVNLVAGLLLVGIGGGMQLVAKKLTSSAAEADSVPADQ